MNAEPEWIDGNRFRLAGESFGTGFDDSTTDRIVVCKPRPLVEATIALMRDLAPRRIFELGIFNGGSVALNALVVDPDLLVAVDISEERIAALDHLLARRGLDSRVRLHYGSIRPIATGSPLSPPPKQRAPATTWWSTTTRTGSTRPVPPSRRSSRCSGPAA